MKSEDKLGNTITNLNTILNAIAAHQKKVVEMAMILRVVAVHLEETKEKSPDVLFAKINFAEAKGDFNFEKFWEIAKEEKIYRTWLDQ